MNRKACVCLIFSAGVFSTGHSLSRPIERRNESQFDGATDSGPGSLRDRKATGKGKIKTQENPLCLRILYTTPSGLSPVLLDFFASRTLRQFTHNLLVSGLRRSATFCHTSNGFFTPNGSYQNGASGQDCRISTRYPAGSRATIARSV